MGNKTYYDSEDNQCTLSQMVLREPHWAEARIREGEAAIDLIFLINSRLGVNWVQRLAGNLQPSERIKELY
jgi:hypothetical protein